MEKQEFLDEAHWEKVRMQGKQLDEVLAHMVKECDLAGDGSQELLRQEAFLRALLESEERKAQAQEAMEMEQEKLRDMIAQLEKMKP